MTGSDLALLAYRYGQSAWTNWLGHVTISSFVRSLIYGMVFKLMHA